MKTNFLFPLLILIMSLASCKKESAVVPSQALQSASSPDAFTSIQTANTIDGSALVSPALFVKEITNPYFPLAPGTLFKYINTIVEGGRVSVEHITVTVTHDTKNILGVECTVVHDEVITHGTITEDTYDWYAQDKRGNVWYFGEDTKKFSHGQVDSSGSFEAGVNGALPGISMLAHPASFIGTSYYQEYYKGEAEDQATVFATNSTAAVVYGTFTNCLVTKEFTKLEPGVLEYKYYSPGVGQVLTVLNKGGEEREELISITKF